MILQWTSSVNNLTLPTGSVLTSDYDSTYSYEDVMKYHVWNFYNELSSSGWVPQSSSYSSSSGYVTSRTWPSINNLSFPEKMAENITKQDLYDQKGIIYTPVEHCWVTLKKVFSSNEIYYLTIDCRYPLPPHVSNTGLIVDVQVSDDATITYLEVPVEDEKKLFIGPTSIEKKSKAIKSDNTEQPNVWSNTQEINSLDGICFRDNTTTKFAMTPIATVAPNGQDYISRCVAFVDISVFKASYTNDSEISNVDASDGLGYVSATTRVRPKNKKDDENSWYICWGFDFLDSETKTIKDKIQLQNYKYAFHKDASGHFIYQIYKIGDSTFRSGFGFLPVQNKNANDTIGKTSLCINCDPSTVYGNNSINFNTLGTDVALITGNDASNFKLNISTKLNEYKVSKKTVNNFFNTCYRNYNFSDGISTIKAGIGGNIGQYMQLPIYAPTVPKDAAIFMHSASYVTSNDVSPTALMSTGPVTITYAKKFTGATETSKLNLFSKNYVVPNFSKRTNSNYMIKVPLKTNYLTKEYVIYKQETGGNKKILINTDGSALKGALNTISSLGSVPSSDLVGNPVYVGNTDSTDSISKIFKDIYITVTKNNNSSIKFADFINLFNSEFFENSKGYIRFYVGNIAKKNYIPKGTGTQLLWNSAIGTIIKNSSFKPEAVASIQSLYQDNPSTITATSVKDYLAYTEAEMAGTIIKPKTGTLNWTSAADVSGMFYIDVPLNDIYDLSKCTYVDETNAVLTQIASGDFDSILPGVGDVQVNQYQGANFFSVFKSSYLGEQQPLAGAAYSFSNDVNSVSNASLFGTINKNNSSDNRFIVNKDINNTYPELPIFLLSMNTKYMIKGYVPDITWAPNGVNELSVVADGVGPKNYKKVYWGGCWFPWVTDYAPDV